MSEKVRTNFGQINGQRVITFQKGLGHDLVAPAKYKRMADEVGFHEMKEAGLLITSRESFRRWKVARKAWHSRKWARQIPLPL